MQRRVVTQAKTREERAWLCEVASVALVQSVRDAHRAFSNFFDSVARGRRGRKVGRPRSKSRKDSRQSCRLTRNGFGIRLNGTLYLAKIGEVRVRWSRELPSSKTCSACGHVMDDMPLKIRDWTCPKCATVHDRDHRGPPGRQTRHSRLGIPGVHTGEQVKLVLRARVVAGGVAART